MVLVTPFILMTVQYSLMRLITAYSSTFLSWALELFSLINKANLENLNKHNQYNLHTHIHTYPHIFSKQTHICIKNIKFQYEDKLLFKKPWMKKKIQILNKKIQVGRKHMKRHSPCNEMQNISMINYKLIQHSDGR